MPLTLLVFRAGRSLFGVMALALAGILPYASAQAETSLHFVTESFPPFNYEADGKVAGPMVEILNAVCQSAKVTCTAELKAWRRALAEAENGEVDGIFSIVHGADREKMFFLSDPIIQTAYSFFARKSFRWKYNSPDNLNDMTIGVYGPSGTSRALEEINTPATSAKVIVEPSNFDVFRALIEGHYGAQSVVVANRDVGLNLLHSPAFLEKIPDARDIVAVGDIKQIAYCFGLSRKKATEAQMTQLNAALRRLTASGKIDQILRKHKLHMAAELK